MVKFTVCKITWAGLMIPVESFYTLKDAKAFCKNYKNFSLAVYFDGLKVYESEAV